MKATRILFAVLALVVVSACVDSPTGPDPLASDCGVMGSPCKE